MSNDGKKPDFLEGRVRLDFRPYLLSDWDVPDDSIPDSEWTTTVGEVLALAAPAASGSTIEGGPAA